VAKKMKSQEKIDQACLMSCQHRTELDDWETQILCDQWIASKQSQLRMADMAIIAVACTFLCLMIGLFYSIHTGDWTWIDGPEVR
jgi:predicted alpha/beta hydrolase family esterase